MTKQKTIKAWGIINKRGNLITDFFHYLIYKTKKEAGFNFVDENEKIVKIEIKIK